MKRRRLDRSRLALSQYASPVKAIALPQEPGSPNSCLSGEFLFACPDYVNQVTALAARPTRSAGGNALPKEMRARFGDDVQRPSDTDQVVFRGMRKGQIDCGRNSLLRHGRRPKEADLLNH